MISWNKQDVESLISFLLCQPPSDEKRIMRILADMKKCRDALSGDSKLIIQVIK